MLKRKKKDSPSEHGHVLGVLVGFGHVLVGLYLSECFGQQALHGLSLFKLQAVMPISASSSGAWTCSMNLF